MENPLKILGLSSGCSLKEAKSSFKLLSLKFHPDKNPSPDASKRFRSIKNAYDTLQKNPDLLDTRIGPRGESLYIEVKISSEEIYFSKEKTVSIKKLVRCNKCLGTGSEDKTLLVCALCDGIGNISNEILEFLNKECQCPLCKGLGITPTNICKSCKGRTVTNSIVKESAPVRGTDHNRVILKGKGNAGRLRGPCGDISVLFIDTKGYFYFKDEILTTDIEVSPAQFILGGDLRIKICGEDFCFSMCEMTRTQTIVYSGKPININYKIRVPEGIEENKELYKVILENEKKVGSAFKQKYKD